MVIDVTVIFSFMTGADWAEERIGGGRGGDKVEVQSLDNLCGDLNKGYLPKSPLKRNINGQSYPLYGRLLQLFLGL